MPKIKFNQTVQFKRETYKLGEIVEFPVGEVDYLSQYGEILKEEPKKEVVKQPKKSTRKSTRKADN